MKLLLLELASLAGFANAILYVGGFFRKLENERQAEASNQNTRISVLEGKVDALINSTPSPKSEKSCGCCSDFCSCSCHNRITLSSSQDLKDLLEEK